MAISTLYDTEQGQPLPATDFLASREAITRFIFVRDRPAAVDLCLVLGSASMSSMAPAIDLFRRGLTPFLLISGHGPSPEQTPEWRIYRDYALEHGVPDHAILIEPDATNTRENFSFSRALIASRFGWNSIRTIAIVGKPYHMRRALMTARRQWPASIELVMLPCDHPDDPSAGNWWSTEEGRHWVFRELGAIATYAVAGDIGGF